MDQETSVNQRLQDLVARFRGLDAVRALPNSVEYQSQLWSLIQDFSVLNRIAISLDLYSDNEQLEEINVNYLPFITIDYYLAELYLNYLHAAAPKSEKPGLDSKEANLKIAKNYYTDFLEVVDQFGLLSETQKKQHQDGYVLTREQKIEAHKKQKALEVSLQSMGASTDEDVKRQLYIDEINLYAMKTLGSLQLLTMELQVLSNRPKEDAIAESDDRTQSKARVDSYTTRLESVPRKQAIGDIVSNGKVLQPFTFTRQDLKSKLFGTGQELPSMTVEEYLDYELKNGKMLKPEEPQPEERDTDDEDEEIRKREWDDWKDANPKGSGNMGSNLG